MKLDLSGFTEITCATDVVTVQHFLASREQPLQLIAFFSEIACKNEYIYKCSNFWLDAIRTSQVLGEHLTDRCALSLPTTDRVFIKG